jgi:hypothetical protein
MSKSRVLASAALTGVLVLAGLTAGPAFADDPAPLVWSPVSTVTAGDVTVTWETASSTFSPFGGAEMLDPMPVFRPEITNLSSGTKYFGFGTDFVTQGTIDPLWTADAWGAFTDVIDESSLLELFWVELPGGASLSSGATGGSASSWYSGMPSWSGHTIRIFELSASPDLVAVPDAVPLASVSTPGGFVAADLSDGDIGNLSAVLGQRATVAGGGGTAELFPGLTATVEASGLTPDTTMEVWIAKDLNYAYFQILGGGLPVGAQKIGERAVGANGTLSSTFTLPSDLALGRYQLVIGVRGERYWPAGSYDDFEVTAPATTASDTIALSDASASIDLGLTQVTLAFPGATSAGDVTAAVSTTGPIPDGFFLASNPPLYYHVDSTANLGGASTICIVYNPATLPDGAPRLYHFDTSVPRWVDITTSQEAGRTCGLTSSFSPFTLGYPPTFDFSGFFNPVSMTAENIAKPGQAIPVKFSLHGDQGLDVVTSARFVTEGNATSLVGDVIETTTAGGGGLSYDARSDQYTYVWKTPKTLSLKTGRFELTLSDGTVHSFNVTFKK